MNFHRASAIYPTIAILLISLLGSCGQPFDFDVDHSDDTEDNDGSDPVAVSVTDENFTLAWDPAEGDITGYEVFYRAHGNTSWTQLDETGVSDTPRYTVSSSELDYGTYEFAVRATISGGGTTEYHTSLDSTASPESGWYLDWTG